jgi:Ni/Fe-hydrogenase subunit HybB-like protein
MYPLPIAESVPTRKKGGGPDGAHDQLSQQVLGELAGTLAPPARLGQLWIGSLVLVILAGVFAFIYQLVNGLKVTGMREHVSWGVYMTNFVFFIGVSHAGTLISAILRVTHAEWRRSITRMAEAITVFALLVGAPMVIIDMGRPDRILNVLLHGRLSSPILWDVCSIATYISGSLLYLYVAMIPDMALLSPRTAPWERPTWRARLYRFLSLGYRGTPEQKIFLERALATMAIIIIPVAISVHTVVSWIFGMTTRPGWHSTVFGPYFVIGAIFSGTAAIITAMAIFRKVYRLEKYLTELQFRNLGRLMLALNLLYIYFTLAEYLTTWYGSLHTEARLLDLLMGLGPYGYTFWLWAGFGLFLPAIIVLIPDKKHLIARLVVASILINIGMWIKRYLIVVPTLMTPYIPAEAGGVIPQYTPTWVEWAITAAGFATFMLLFTLFAKLFPIISIWETVEGVQEIGAKQIGVDLELPRKPAPFQRFRPAPALLILLLLIPAVTILGQETSNGPPPVQIKLEAGTDEYGDEVLIATVTNSEKPIADAEVNFFVRRTFGRLHLGTETTSDIGQAAITFPKDLPGDAAGQLRIFAELTGGPSEGTSVCTEAGFEPRMPGRPDTDFFPRALWAPRAPWAVVLTIAALLTLVWSHFFFVIFQLFKIRKS